MRSAATFSEDRSRRFLLSRDWDRGPRVAFVCLNPSTADETVNDQSIKKMIRFAELAGAAAVDVVNLFDVRATDPALLYKARSLAELSSPTNDETILYAAHRSWFTICAWGTHGKLFDRGRAVLELFRRAGRLRSKLYALKLNADGTPAHPLMLPYSLKPFKLEI